ncbi:MAG: hypothetical protein OEZ58_08835, partial [Gammaproteobacteria bacterium]|nr:hypothetical protein [Gammaproteobacteria bacterium]
MREPIAIVGRGCVLPGADSPEKLGQLFNQNKIVIDHAPKDYWRLKNPIEFLNSKQAEFSWHDLGGYVREFNFNSNEFDLGEYASDLKFLDDGIKWLLYATKQAFVEAGYNAKRYPTCGVVLGNLSYPSHAFSRYCESVWFHTLFGKRFDNVPAINRFCSGTPAHILAKAFGLGRSAFSLDAACASSIYALRFACDALIEGRADLMLAAGLNHADDLFIHAGFTALQALSKQGESLPFGDKADGLIPAEGCAVVLLKRLADAERDGDTIHCIVRAIGLSNSGRSRTVLAPSVEAQVKSMELAYVESAIEPSTVQHMECHATGTIVGDAVELESIRRVFKHNRRLSLSSSKLNIGHSITVSGLVSLLRLTEAMRQNTLPNHPVPEPISDLQESSLNLIQTFKSWDSEGPRRAAINNFGFGGTNAHCVIDEWVVGQSYETFQLSKTDEICVVAMEMSSGKLANLDAHIGTDDASLTARQSELGNFSFSYTDLTIPPVDLEKSLAQHNLVLHLVINACQQIEEMPDRDRVAVFVGMGCDTQGARSGFRWRLYDLLNHYNIILTTEELEQLKASTGLLVDFESAIGVMPNIPANRINQIFDWRAMSCTISSEEVSGLDALDLAIDALKTCRIDMAIVAAIEIGSEQAHQHALKTITGHDIVCMDAGAVLVLKRESIVNESNETIHAKFHDSIGTHAKPIDCPDWMNKYNFHAASGLLALAGSILRAQTMEKIEKDIDSKNYYRFEYSSFTQQQRHFHFSVATNSVAIRLEKGKQKETSTTQLCIPVMANNFQPWAERLPSNDHYVMQAAPRLVLCSTPVLEKSLTSQAENKTLNQPQLTRKNLNISPSKTHVNQLMQGLLEGHEQYLAAQAKAMKAYINTQDALMRKVFFVKPLENQLKIRTETTNHEKEKIKTRSYPFTTHAVNGPVFNRNQLEVLASGRVSQIFGEKFSFQDQYSKQVRMPKPPLLLADKVLGIEAKPLAMQHGIIWTETTIKANEWYLHNNRLLPGLLIESGQADLLLISWLGVDLENQGQRVYRLLGCELSFHQQKLPQAGDQLVFEIRIIQHSKLGDVRLFFFEYDCWLNGSLFFSVREGQAGFFSQTALDRSAGVVISDECSFLDPLATWRRQSHGEQIHFSAEQLEQLRQGNAFACFGSGFEKLAAHNHTPSIPGGRMALFHEIECLIFKGGPWGKGYAKAIYQVQADDWYFQGHFLNDPCMPGTLMADVSIQLINFFMLASGDSLERDAWHFEPLINSKAKFVCRGQVTPDSKSIQYEIFVRQHSNNQIPFVEASVLVSCDGLRIFYCPSISVRMSPGFLSDYRILDYKNVTPTYVDEVNSVRGDFDGLLHSAIGQPSLALGDKYKKYDNGLRCPRLPGPPYQFITQIHSVSHASGEIANNARLNAIYEFSGDEWYFKDEPLNTMPFAVLLEVCLQPCGWLSSHMGFALPSKKDLFFR